MSASERSPPGTDDSASHPPPTGILRAFWRRLRGRPHLRPLGAEAIRRIADEWRSAERHIERIEAEATTPPRASADGPAQRFDELCAGLEDSIARLRAPLPQAATGRVGPRGVAEPLRRARQQLRDAEEMLDAIAERARYTAEAAAEWERRAMLAVEAGSDTLAREALAHRAEMANLYRPLQREVTAGRAVLAEMRAALDRIAPAGDDAAKR